MEIRNDPPTRGPHGRLDFTKPNRVGIEKSVEHAEHVRELRRQEAKELEQETEASSSRGSDRIDLSPQAKMLAEEGSVLPGETPEARAERVADLRTAFEAGTLNTPELVERAAEGLLSGN
ncbi:MAG: flagellar biosynthesis anti-sigma factor FlgM [Planctomycetota bacterium]|nr:MAG: flagellar biosynthesis anti-sigma factor FlgM [Planctomycetota bacterium]